MTAANSPKKRTAGQGVQRRSQVVSITLREEEFRGMPASGAITIKLRPGIARVQENAVGHTVDWVEPPAECSPNLYLPLNHLLPLPGECHPEASAWAVLPEGAWTLFLRLRRDGSSCRVEAWFVSRDDYLACQADAPAIIQALEACPRARTAQLFEIKRSAGDLRDILMDGDAPTLLGAAQLLVDGGVLHFPAQSPIALEQVAALWALLPTRQRALLGWTTHLNSTRHKLAIGAGPTSAPGAWTWETAGDYPEGHYERSLHQAATSGDEEAVNRLLTRGSRWDVMVMGLILLGALVVGQLVLAATGWKPPPLFRPVPGDITP